MSSPLTKFLSEISVCEFWHSRCLWLRQVPSLAPTVERRSKKELFRSARELAPCNLKTPVVGANNGIIVLCRVARLVVINQTQEVLAMEKAAEKGRTTQGLCSTCNHFPTCVYRLNRLVVWYCEEFDDYVPPRSKPRDISQPVITPPNSNDQDKFMGLCVNCENRDQCVHARRPGGVWQCEEYV